VKGARESKAFNEVFTNESAKRNNDKRINSYVDLYENKKQVINNSRF
jgi:hypothetical protein